MCYYICLFIALLHIGSSALPSSSVPLALGPLVLRGTALFLPVDGQIRTWTSRLRSFSILRDNFFRRVLAPQLLSGSVSGDTSPHLVLLLSPSSPPAGASHPAPAAQANHQKWLIFVRRLPVHPRWYQLKRCPRASPPLESWPPSSASTACCCHSGKGMER